MRNARSTLIESVNTSGVTQAVVGAGIAAIAGWGVSTGHGSLLLTAAIVLIGGLALMRWPAATVFALLILCQELDPSGGFGAGGSSLLFLGHQVYFTTFSRVSLLTLILVVACARVALVDPPPRPRVTAAGLVALMGVWYIGLVWVKDVALTSAINQDARYALIFILTFVLGAWAREAREWRVNGIEVMQWLFTLAALIGVYLDLTGQGQVQTGLSVIFYDSAFGAVAGAVVIAIALAPAHVRTWRVWWLGGAALIIVVLSSRRNVWAAMIVALLVGLAVARNRTRLVLRALAGLAVLLVLIAVAAPSVMSELGHQLSAIWQATQGSASDASAQGHLSDISSGWRAVLASPISGVGPNGHLAGLVVENGGQLYIHNQILESWLRFGIVGALLIIAVQIVLVVQAIALLRRHSGELTASWAAFLLIMAPVAMLTAPFFTETQRWPALLGLSAGLVAAQTGRRARAAPDLGATSPAPGQPLPSRLSEA